MDILIVNTHSVLNSGDSGILLAQIDLLKKYFKKVHISLVSRTPGIDRNFYKNYAEHIFYPLFPAPSIFYGQPAQVLEFLKSLFSFRHKIKLIRKIIKCDLVISSGGGYFWTYRKWIPGPMFFQNYFHVWIALFLKKPVIFFPQSFGPFHNQISLKMMSRVLSDEKTIKIFSREMISCRLIKNLISKQKDLDKIDLCPDLAFFLEKKPVEEKISYKKRKELTIALTLRQWDFPNISKKQKDRYNKRYIVEFEKYCQDFYHSHGASFIIFPQSRGPGNFEDDRMISKTLFSRLKKTIPESNLYYPQLPEDVSPYVIIDLLSKADLALTTRLHSAIFSFISGTPVISINYQHKGEGIMRELGIGKFCLDIEKIDAEKIKKISNHILEDKDKFEFEMSQRIKVIRNKILIHMGNFLKSLEL